MRAKTLICLGNVARMESQTRNCPETHPLVAWLSTAPTRWALSPVKKVYNTTYSRGETTQLPIYFRPFIGVLNPFIGVIGPFIACTGLLCSFPVPAASRWGITKLATQLPCMAHHTVAVTWREYAFFVWDLRWCMPPKTNMTGWKIPIFDMRYIDSFMVVFRLSCWFLVV